MVFHKGLDFRAVLDGLGQAVLLFDSANRLVYDNPAARAILGQDLRFIRVEGWAAAAVLFDARLGKQDRMADDARAEALASTHPVRFHIYRSGEYIPCWASAVRGEDGELFTMIAIETPDWTALRDLLDRFLDETRAAVEATRGHADLIAQSLKRSKPNESIQQLSRRISGFTDIISTHMHRVALLLDFMARMEDIRTGSLRRKAVERRRKIMLADFIEDFLEELDSIQLIDPQTDAQDYRARIHTAIPTGLAVSAAPGCLTAILRDLLRNAIMYSMRASPVLIQARADGAYAQIDMIDEGYGIRASETERVFMPFERARQPQIMGEFGYGVSLFLCKHEVEAMSGRMWFASEEGVGSTFSFKLPAWRDDQTLPPSATETITTEVLKVSESSDRE